MIPSVLFNILILAVQNSSIGDLITDWLNDSLTEDFTNWHTKNNIIVFIPSRHLIRVMKGHVLTPKKTNTMTKTKSKTHTAYWQLRHLISSDDLRFRVFSNGAIIGTCDICDTDYNTENWEPGLMTIFVTWQLIVTLDSIRNSCDVFHQQTQWS